MQKAAAISTVSWISVSVAPASRDRVDEVVVTVEVMRRRGVMYSRW
jgi:hypothetical protein